MSTATTNLYTQPFLRVEKRRDWMNFVSNQTIFDPVLIYQPNNPNFGVQSQLKMTVEFGIQQLNLADYTPALTQLYRKRLYFGDVKVARALDVYANYTYDVVYVDVIDYTNGVNSQITANNTNYYPNSIDNMRNSLSLIKLPDNSNIFIDVNQIPRFMQSLRYAEPMDYIQVAVLCYTLPNQGNIIAKRVRQSQFDFKQLDFEIDRLIVENTLDNPGAKYLIFPRTRITDPGV
jgi:hypothetical protein